MNVLPELSTQEDEDNEEDGDKVEEIEEEEVVEQAMPDEASQNESTSNLKRLFSSYWAWILVLNVYPGPSTQEDEDNEEDGDKVKEIEEEEIVEQAIQDEEIVHWTTLWEVSQDASTSTQGNLKLLLSSYLAWN